jgi:hypothetical protein
MLKRLKTEKPFINFVSPCKSANVQLRVLYNWNLHDTVYDDEEVDKEEKRESDHSIPFLGCFGA